MAEVVVRAAVFGPRDDRGSAAALCAASGWRRDGRQYFHRSHLNPRQQLRLKKRGSVCSDLFARICLLGSVCSDLFARICLLGSVCSDLFPLPESVEQTLHAAPGKGKRLSFKAYSFPLRTVKTCTTGISAVSRALHHHAL